MLRRIDGNGVQTLFSNVSGVTDEIKIAVVRSGNKAGFIAGDLFTGNGAGGEIMRISDSGNTVIKTWCSLGSDQVSKITIFLFV